MADQAKRLVSYVIERASLTANILFFNRFVPLWEKNKSYKHQIMTFHSLEEFICFRFNILAQRLLKGLLNIHRLEGSRAANKQNRTSMKYKPTGETSAVTNFGLQIFFVILCGAVLALFVWFFEVKGVYALIRQYQAQSFPTTEGQVLSARMVSHKGSKGAVSYYPAFLYTYNVNGQCYEERRYRYDGYTLCYDEANSIVTSHPAGSTIEVYYNPDDPADAVLSPAVVSQDVWFLFLPSPFGYIFLYCLLNAWKAIVWPGRVKPVAGGVKIMTDMLTTRVRLPRYLPIDLGLITAGILSFSAGIVILFADAPSAVSAGLFALLIIIVVSALVFFLAILENRFRQPGFGD